MGNDVRSNGTRAENRNDDFWNYLDVKKYSGYSVYAIEVFVSFFKNHRRNSPATFESVRKYLMALAERNEPVPISGLGLKSYGVICRIFMENGYDLPDVEKYVDNNTLYLKKPN